MPITVKEKQGYKNKKQQAKGGGGMDIGKSDVALLSRALSVARGMVSPSSIKAENKSRIKNVNRGKAKGGKVKK